MTSQIIFVLTFQYVERYFGAMIDSNCLKAKDILFALLRNVVCGKELNEETKIACTPENLEEVYQIARKHDLAHLVAHAIEGLNVPECEILVKLKKAKMMALYRYARLDYELGRICDILEKGNIPFIPLKGSVLRAFYPEPWMRTSSDIDVLVKMDDLETAVLHLEKNGFHRTGKGHHDVSLYSAGGVHLELHFDLIEEAVSAPAQSILKQVWDLAEKKPGMKMELVLPDELFWFYHIAHMAKHFSLGGGCGIRPFLDIWMMDNCFQIEQKKKENLLKQGGLLTFSNAAEKLSRCWFSNAPWDDNTVRFANAVINGSSFGTRKNRAAVRKAAGNAEKIPWKRIVIPYEDLRYSYPALDKKTWLMPLYQVARWFRLIGHLVNLLKRRIAMRKVSNEAEKEMQKILHYLAL